MCVHLLRGDWERGASLALLSKLNAQRLACVCLQGETDRF